VASGPARRFEHLAATLQTVAVRVVTAGGTGIHRVVRVNESPKSVPAGVLLSGKAPGRRGDLRVPPPSGHRAQDEQSQARRARALWVAAVVVLCPVAGIGASLSFQSLHEAAESTFGSLAVGFALLVDMLILGSTLAFLAGATVGRERSGWRWTAHGGVIATLVLNALAASSPATIPWHITPALVWSVLVEMTARQVIGDWKILNAASTEPIPTRLWLISPLDSFQTWLQMARTGELCHRQARADLAVHAAAVQALKAAMPRRRQRGTRNLIRKQLHAGALDPAALLRYLHRDASAEHHTAVIVQAFLNEESAAEVSNISSRPSGTARARVSPHGRPPDPSEQARTTCGKQHARDEASEKRPHRSPDLRQRQAAAVEILRTRPDVDAHQLAQNLADQGWQVVSPRTARRILSQASRELAPSPIEHGGAPVEPAH
jgi:hypothetical protein